jgi:hypothetical protein
MTTNAIPMTDKAEAEWFAHCAEMKRLYDIKAAELIAAGWRRHGRGRLEYFTRKGEQPVVIRRQLGSAVWYTTEKDF